MSEKCYGCMKVYKTCDDCVVDLCQRAPEFATVGSPYPVEISITARKECADVIVNQTLPCDSEFIRSDPPARPDGNNSLRWEFPHMTKGQTQKIVVWIRPMKEGCCLAAATVCACPQLCAYTRCGQPVVCIEKTGPECACLYCPVRYNISVCNSGSATAFDVVVQDNVPDGLSHASGMSCLTYNLGDLCPGQRRCFSVDFCATKRGCVTNTATVSFCGGPKCSAQASTLIVEPCVDVTKTGPDWAYICKVVDYNITVTNPGDMVLRDIVVDDVSPIGTTVVAAPGAEICCNRALWCIPQLCPGETKTFTVSVRSQVPGCLTNKVTVTTQSDCGPCTSCAEATTCWKGMAATHMCMVDTCDPICVGDGTVFRICVSNRGTDDDTNVRLVIKFTDELQPQTVNGPTRGSISGNTVTFEPIERLSPKQSVEYCICVKGVSTGDARAEATLSSDTLTSPVVNVEPAHVY
ncbi:MAG: OmcB family cysteine-rich outer membrane protein [Chlamydiales bacterium]